VHYDEFVKDPLGTVGQVYDALRLPFDGGARAAVTQADDVSHRGDRRPDHRYSLEEFGLTADQVTERFAAYLSAYPGID